jgi:CubicO group peptidase (beta-lactamase class C family)
MMCRWCLLFLILAAWRVLAAAPVYSPPVFTDPERLAKLRAVLPRLDRLYLEQAAEKHLPGLICGVMVDGELVHVFAHGRAHLGTGRRVERDTRFRIASMTKSFTAMAVLLLRDEGKLALDEPVTTYFPAFRAVQPLTTDSPPVTLRHLLRMSGGFPQDDPWGDRRLADSVEQLEQLVSPGLRFSRPTGVRWEYSNLGYALLGQVVTVVAGQPYQEFIRNRLLQPLGMTSTVWEAAEVPADRFATGYRWEKGVWREEPVLGDGTFGAMGGLITTIDDFARYVAFHLDAWPPRNDPDAGPVRRATLREMHRPSEVIGVVKDSAAADGREVSRLAAYGYGLSYNQDERGIIWIRHAGGLPGYGSEYRFLPDHGVALIALSNLTYAPMTALNAKAMEVLVTGGGLVARMPVASPVLQQRARDLTLLLQTWDPAVMAAALAPNLFQDRDEADWRLEASTLLTQTGAIRSMTPVEAENQLRGRFRLVGERGSIEVYFTLMPEAEPKVQELKLSFSPLTRG